MGHSDAWWKMYEALRGRGMTKQQAAKITNAKMKKGKK
jgi:hypothetical protein